VARWSASAKVMTSGAVAAVEFGEGLGSAAVTCALGTDAFVCAIDRPTTVKIKVRNNRTPAIGAIRIRGQIVPEFCIVLNIGFFSHP